MELHSIVQQCPADVVIGQPDLFSNQANRGTSVNRDTLSAPTGLACSATGLLIGDLGNHRVLIYNSLPTVNGAPADMVIGQADFVSNSLNRGGTCSALSLRGNTDIIPYYSDEGRLLISDNGNHRVLIWNTVPNELNVPADFVLGQGSFTTCLNNSGGQPSASTLSGPRAIAEWNGKLVISEIQSRLLMWNSIPNTNGAPADMVLGQSSFSTVAANRGTGVAANTLWSPKGVVVDGTRLFIGDQNNHRILVYNSLPTSNGASADVAIGQPSLQTNLINQGGSANSSTLSSPQYLGFSGGKIFVPDYVNNRVLIYHDNTKLPSMSLSRSPSVVNGSLLKMSGMATVEAPYTLRSVEFAVNQSGFSGARLEPTTNPEETKYSFEYDPGTNQPRDISGVPIPGHTLRIKAINSNTDVVDSVFYFTPFDSIAPSEGTESRESKPSFSFEVNAHKQAMAENLSHYQIQVKPGGKSSDAAWQTYIDQIAIDFHTVKSLSSNLQRDVYAHLSTNTGVYETDQVKVEYDEDSTKITATSKTQSLAGVYAWRAVAIDKAGSSQYSQELEFVVVGAEVTTNATDFPLAILSITGVGDPLLNSYDLSRAKTTYQTRFQNPQFYGIAWSDSRVELLFTEKGCETECQLRLETRANLESRFGINLESEQFKAGATYTISARVEKDGKYTQLPAFELKLGNRIN